MDGGVVVEVGPVGYWSVFIPGSSVLSEWIEVVGEGGKRYDIATVTGAIRSPSFSFSFSFQKIGCQCLARFWRGYKDILSPQFLGMKSLCGIVKWMPLNFPSQ